ncbi:tyrosine-type recombinase/integrase [Methylorubrum sp. SB2]|uniref:tyrosine-type recombinase/integrase n=1 Tax=Methylorubrum subtropicum TaxID=3138812 RepID=UPI00313E0562
MSGDYLLKRDGVWHFSRRVPFNVADLDRRGIVRQSTRIRVVEDPRGAKARRIADQINADLEAFWLGLLNGRAEEAQKVYDAARKRARGFGFDYMTADAVAARPVSEILARLQTIKGQPQEREELAASALGGGVPVPRLMLSGLFNEFERLSASDIRDLSPDQVRKWRNPKVRAVANLIDVIGDQPISSITRPQALDFREWWQARVADEDLDPDTANKDFGHLNTMFKTVERALRIGLGPVFSEMRIRGANNGQRVAFAPAFVQDRFLADGALDGLNDDARCVLYLIVETGLRLSEACNLTEETIRLSGPAPHVVVKPDGRRMKTDQSAREIPLVGVSLMAAQASPAGFPRYRDKAASLSAIVNKVLRGRGLLPEAGQTLYSLRHTFEDRLTKVEAPEKVTAALMGHKFHRPRYGLGPSLEQKREWLQRIAFKPPSKV